MNIDLSSLATKVIGVSISKNSLGTLSGHAAGEPFDKYVHKYIAEIYPNKTYRQFEYLNQLYLAHPDALSAKQRYKLIPSKPLAYLLNRGIKATNNWTPTDQFEEKQNDTADILVVKDNVLNIIDVKTFNVNKKGQPPNIISSYKLAHLCKKMLENEEFDTINIIYILINWELIDEKLISTGICIKELFKATPENLYINWAAALQIQFHVDKLDQNYHSNIKEWCKRYLTYFVKQGEHRIITMRSKFIDPFINYL
ncbi:MAG: HincII family type II restriction endonuclease [Bellilinea sp.]